MKKNLSVAINGSNFIIDEDAFDVLDKYISELKVYFAEEDSSDEIISDIEARIEELLTSRVGSSNRGVTLDDINYIIDTMGRVKDIDNDLQDEHQENAKTGTFIKRKFYRDIDNNYLGGVCAGLAKYFNMDIMVVRLIFICFLFLWSSSLWIYLIIWIVVPAAKTNTQKLEMDGKEPSIDNLEEHIRNKANSMKDDFVKGNHVMKEKIRNSSDGILKVITLIARTLSGTIGIVFALATLSIAVTFVLSALAVIPMPFDFYNTSVFALAMQSSSYMTVLCLSLGMMTTIPIALLADIALSFAFKGTVKLGTSWAVIGGIWIISIIVFIGLITRI